MFADDIRVFTTCPQSKDHMPADYLRRLQKVAKWSDEFGCTGMLIYSDNSIVDPWVVAQYVINESRRLVPLVAVQPVYMHPYTVAKMVASLGVMYDRAIWLNMIAGGFRNDLLALGDPTEHDQRYARLAEYATIIRRLMTGEPVTYRGTYYQIENLRMTPLHRHLPSEFLMSGSSEASRLTAIDIDATVVEYPEEKPQQYAITPAKRGVRVGIMAHHDADVAWRMAHDRFPPDRRGQLQHSIAIRVSDSVWQRTLGASAAKEAITGNPYWLGPFRNYQTFCPYLVGDYATVAREIAGFLRLGYRTFILDIPRYRGDLAMAQDVFRLALGAL